MPRFARFLVLLAAASFAPALPAAEKIGALGHIVPQGGVVRLAGYGDVIRAVTVEPGRTVNAGDALVEFAGHRSAELDLQVARDALREAEDAAPRTQATRERGVELAKRELTIARERLERYEKLNASSVAPQELATRRQQVFAAEQALADAQSLLEAAQIAGPIALEKARAVVALAEEKLAHSTLRAPMAGTILEVAARVGEQGGGVLVALADLSRMTVEAEVFEADLSRVKLGAACELSSSAFAHPLPGHVERVSRLVNAQTKAATVRIALDAPEPAARYLGMEVTVSISP